MYTTDASPLFFEKFLSGLSVNQYVCKGSKEQRNDRGVVALLTVELETEMNGDPKSTKGNGSFLGWFIGLVVPVQVIFVLPWLL
jgi:hypothetical protein